MALMGSGCPSRRRVPLVPSPSVRNRLATHTERPGERVYMIVGLASGAALQAVGGWVLSVPIIIALVVFTIYLEMRGR